MKWCLGRHSSISQPGPGTYDGPARYHRTFTSLYYTSSSMWPCRAMTNWKIVDSTQSDRGPTMVVCPLEDIFCFLVAYVSKYPGYLGILSCKGHRRRSRAFRSPQGLGLWPCLNFSLGRRSAALRSSTWFSQHWKFTGLPAFSRQRRFTKQAREQDHYNRCMNGD